MNDDDVNGVSNPSGPDGQQPNNANNGDAAISKYPQRSIFGDRSTVYRHDYTGAKVWCRDKESCGTSTGSRRPCTLEGCNADRIFVRWPCGRRTWPCIKGLEQIGPNEFKII